MLAGRLVPPGKGQFWGHAPLCGLLSKLLWSMISYFYSTFVCRTVKFQLPSVLWHCWLGGRKGIRPVKTWVVGCWHGYLSGARCRLAYGPADATAHCHSLFLASVISRLFFTFLVSAHPDSPGKGPLNGCMCVCLSSFSGYQWCNVTCCAGPFVCVGVPHGAGC